MHMHVAIASRVFDPEPSAASVRLEALASSLTKAGHKVTVFTTKPPKKFGTIARQRDAQAPYKVRRSRVIRDSSGYVRGYLPYLSFDLPLLFRLIFAKRFDVIICEPPPTTGFFVRIVSVLRRIPYVYYAADVWADASQQTEAPAFVVKLVRWLETFAWGGASALLSVSEGVTSRLRELGTTTLVTTVGNGVNTESFTRALEYMPESLSERPTFVYAGTASEWHGADVFVRALPEVLPQVPHTRLRFIGGGSQIDQLKQLANELGVGHAVSFEPLMQPDQLAPILRSATAAVASVKDGAGYDFAFPTKLYSAAVCGAPMIYAGPGPAITFVRNEFDGIALGHAVALEPADVAVAMVAATREPHNPARRTQVSEWAASQFSLSSVAEKARMTIEEAVHS